MRFSSRVPANLEPNRLAQLIASHPPRYDLTLSNPTKAGFVYPDGLLEGLVNSDALTYEPDPRGLTAARQAIAGLYDRPVDPSRVFLTSSTSESYSWLFKLLCDAGDHVLAPRPSYPLFECLGHLDSIEVAQYPLIEQMEWSIDFDALVSQITPRTKAIIVVNPNNPTGSFLKRWEAARLAEICHQHDLPVISDEVFSGYAWRDDPDQVRTLASETRFSAFILNGLSKPAGLPQMKLGWILAPGTAVNRLEWIADAYLPVSAPVQHAASRWLELTPAVTAQIRSRAMTNVRILEQGLRGTAAKILPAEGGWCAIVEVPRIRTEEEWIELFLKAGVLMQPGFFYDFEREAFVVLSLLPESDVFAEAVNRIRLTLIESLS